MAEEDSKPSRGQDTTKTPRQRAYLKRLAEGEGKRLVVDLDGSGRADLEALLASGYGGSQKEVVTKALAAAAKEHAHKTT